MLHGTCKWWWWWRRWNNAANLLWCVMLWSRYDMSHLWCVTRCEECLETLKKSMSYEMVELWKGFTKIASHGNGQGISCLEKKHEHNSIWRTYVSKKFRKHSTLGGNVNNVYLWIHAFHVNNCFNLKLSGRWDNILMKWHLEKIVFDRRSAFIYLTLTKHSIRCE
jgi:hypothetical protein